MTRYFVYRTGNHHRNQPAGICPCRLLVAFVDHRDGLAAATALAAHVITCYETQRLSLTETLDPEPHNPTGGTHGPRSNLGYPLPPSGQAHRTG